MNVSIPESDCQGSGEKDDDYVTRIEFRLLLVSLTAVVSMFLQLWSDCMRMQVYLKQYFELFSLFDDIDSGSVTHARREIHKC